MSDLETIVDAVQVHRDQHPLCYVAETSKLEQDDLTSLLRRPKCPHGDLRQLLRRRAVLRHIQERGV